MRVVAHCSDLHFGREVPAVAEALLADLAAIRPHLVVVSGDLTQRARTAEFRAAAAWLARLPAPRLVVPGNHDVPLYDVMRRFMRPLGRYRRWIDADTMPLWRDDELAVLGLNTARALTWKDGRVSRAQIAAARARLCPLPPAVARIVVTHHGFIPPPTGGAIVGRAALALDVFEDCAVDLLLAGHLHLGYHGDLAVHHPARSRAMIAVQAGTATSERLRVEPNSYNRIVVDGDRLLIEVRSYRDGGFAVSASAAFRRVAHGWVGATDASGVPGPGSRVEET